MAFDRIRTATPWWLRIGLKLVLSRLPLPYSFWRELRLFRHGDMDQPKRALATFMEHAQTAGLLRGEDKAPLLINGADHFTVLELGPGDSLFTAIIAKSLGASRTWLVDAGPFAIMEMDRYADLVAYLSRHGIRACLDESWRTVDDILKGCDCDYLTDGVRSMKRIPSMSVDFCFSNAVLEHVPEGEFARMADELYRVLRPEGISVHRVDLTDHLGGGLNSLRFSRGIWEGALFRDSGFYTNRIRFHDMISIFAGAGFTCRLPRVIRWEKLPISRSALADPFRSLPGEDLLVRGFDLVLSRNR